VCRDEIMAIPKIIDRRRFSRHFPLGASINSRA
jgi:hypothetical protein